VQRELLGDRTLSHGALGYRTHPDRTHPDRPVSLEVRLAVRRLGCGTLSGGTLSGGTLCEWAVSLDFVLSRLATGLVLWAILVRHLVLLLGLALDARFLTP
jgi:hypothetical protein